MSKWGRDNRGIAAWTRSANRPILSVVQSRNANLLRRVVTGSAPAWALAAVLVVAGVSPGRAADDESPMQPPDSAAVRAATEERVRSLGHELARTVEQHGPDSVALQAAFLLQAMRAGALGPTEVRVAGPSDREGGAYLEIDIDTGVVLDSDVGDSERWDTEIWRSVVAPVLGAMSAFDIRPRGLEIVIRYATQSYSDHFERKADLAMPVEVRMVRFVLGEQVLVDVAAKLRDLDTVRPEALRASVVAPPTAPSPAK